MSIPGNHARVYRVLEEDLAVLSECRPMREHIDHFLREFSLGNGKCDAPTFSLVCFDSPDNHVVMCCPEVGFASRKTAGAKAWIAFRQLFIHIALNLEKPICTLHACAVANSRGEAAIFAGASSAGKTSILAALLRMGFRLVCDDYAVMSYHTSTIIPFPVGATFSDFHFSEFPDLGHLRRDPFRFSVRGEEQWTVNLADAFTVVDSQDRIAPTHVFFLESDFGARSNAHPISREEYFWRFQEACFTNRASLPRIGRRSPHHKRLAYELATTLASRVRAYHVTNGNSLDTARLISETSFPFD